MARRNGNKNELITCEYCGQKYAASYKHCPFCNEDGTGAWPEAEETEEEAVTGGKRLADGKKKSINRSMSSSGQGPSVRRVISMVVSLALIIAAAGIVISIVRSLTGGKGPTANPKPTATAAATSQPAVPSTPAEPDPGPGDVGTTEPSQPPMPAITSPVANLIVPTSFRLNRDDFTFDAPGQTFQMRITYTPENAQGDVTWKSSDPNVASVSWNGVVTAISKGTVTLTATVDGVGEKTCIVRCNFKDSASSSGGGQSSSGGSQSSSGGSQSSSGGASASSGNLKLSRQDFTLTENEKWRLTVSGTSSAVTWTSTNEAVAKVSADGTVSAVSKGTCKVIATVDGQSLECIVRCSW